MTFLPTAEHRDLAANVRSFLSRTADLTQARNALISPVQAGERWRELNTALGLAALAVPEKYGGEGFGTYELVVVAKELGAALDHSPFLASAALATSLVARSGESQEQRRTLPAMASAAVVATVAPGEKTVTARGGVLSGTSFNVLAADQADVIYVIARDEEANGNIGAFAVESASDGLIIKPRPLVDGTRPTYDLALHGVVGTRVAVGEPVLSSLDIGRLCLAAEAIGGAERCLELTVAYLQYRKQFGRPIGTYQALQHRAADLAAQIELARSAVYYAASVAEAGPQPLAVSVALSASLEAFAAMSADMIQMHGGIGVTWEADPHLYFRRAKTIAALLGDVAWHRRRILDLTAGR